jgi:hypothetical protein
VQHSLVGQKVYPKLPYKPEEVKKVAEFLYDEKATPPTWYKKHYEVMISTKKQFHPLGENQRQPYPLLTNHPNPKIEQETDTNEYMIIA